MAHHVDRLHTAEFVDEAILLETDTERLVVIRFGRSSHDDCLLVDAAMAAAADGVDTVAALYAVDIDEVQEFNAIYELQESPCTVMFFYANRHVDLRGPRSRDDIDWAAYSGDEFADLVRAVQERAKAGRRIVDLG